MKNDWRKFKMLLREAYSQLKELAEIYLDLLYDCLETPALFLIYTPLAVSIGLLYISFVVLGLGFILMLMLIHPIYNGIKFLVAMSIPWIRNLWKPKNQLTNIYSEHFVANLFCYILKNNASELPIVKPSVINDIIPVRETVFQIENSFSFYRFICRYTDNDCDDFSTILNLLDLKISQYLQGRCYMYQITYNEFPVVKIFRVSESLYQQGCYAFDLMVVDCEEKYTYIKSLENSDSDANITINDKDF